MIAIAAEVQVHAPGRGRTERHALPRARVQPAAVPAIHDVEEAAEAVSVCIDRIAVDGDVVGSVRDRDRGDGVNRFSGRNPAGANWPTRGRLAVPRGYAGWAGSVQ